MVTCPIFCTSFIVSVASTSHSLLLTQTYFPGYFRVAQKLKIGMPGCRCCDRRVHSDSRRSLMRPFALTLITSLLVLSMVEASRAQSAEHLPYQDPRLPVEQRAADLVSRMTIAEKVSEMTNSSAAIPRLDVPSFDRWNEGLHGVARSGYATMFPQAIGMADRKSTRLNSSHRCISYAVFCL